MLQDVCGHDLELERLQNQVEQFNSLTQVGSSVSGDRCDRFRGKGVRSELDIV